MNTKKKEFFFDDINKIKGVGKKLSSYLKNKKIEKIKDIIFNFPYSDTDRSKISKLNNLEIGNVNTIKVFVKKIYFPRIRNLPNKVICEDDTGKIEIIYFNSREGYLRKIFPINKQIVISGKVTFYKKKYQITNPEYVTTIENKDYVAKNIPKYSLTKGINEKKYRSISEEIIKKIPLINDWLDNDFINKHNLANWNTAIKKLHTSKDSQNNQSNSFRRIAFDEICANLLSLSKNRKRIKKIKKAKSFNEIISNKILKHLPFRLTNAQAKVLKEINKDLQSERRMFRILQGDVGSGKTIVAMLAIANTIESKYQTAIMGPTEILTRQHYEFAKNIFKKINKKIEYLSGKTELKKRKKILLDLENGEIDLLFGTHALFQKKIKFKKLGLIIIDEQHKFGVKTK